MSTLTDRNSMATPASLDRLMFESWNLAPEEKFVLIIFAHFHKKEN